jgi:hypothetical protein
VLEIKWIKGRLKEPALRRGECDAVPPTEEQEDNAGGGAGGPSLRGRPIDLIDIARVLGQSATIERLDGTAVRTLRDDLTLIRDSLSYATAILAADVVTLSGADTLEGSAEPGRLAEDPSKPFPSRRGAASPSAEIHALDGFDVLDALDDLDLGIDEGLFVRTDHLLGAHRQMAQVDLSSTPAIFQARTLLEEQLAILTERQAAVEARLQQIRAVIIRRYRLAADPARERPA